MALLVCFLPSLFYAAEPDGLWKQASANGVVVNDIFARTRRMVHAWLAYADQETLLLPDRLPGLIRGKLNTQLLYTPHNFGAGEYCKDGLLSVTELLGRTPWYYRMVDITEDYMRLAPVKTRWGNLPDTGAELNGDVLQTLARLIPMTADPRFLDWATRIGDAYIQEILPANNYLPGYRYDFEKKTDSGITRLRDHGNEMIVGLALLHALETDLNLARAER